MEATVFTVAAALLICGSLGVLILRNPVHAALSLVVALISIAVCFIMLEAHLLAAVQIIVYASAIVVLFLFVIMLIGVDSDETAPTVSGPLRAAGIGAGVLVSLQLIALGWDHWVTGPKQASGTPFTTPGTGNVESVATELFSRYVWPFELVAGLLVVAVVGAVVLARSNGASPILTERDAVAADAERVDAVAAAAASEASVTSMASQGGDHQ